MGGFVMKSQQIQDIVNVASLRRLQLNWGLCEQRFIPGT